MSARLWVVIVNFRTADLTLGCLRALSSQIGALNGGRVAIVDNDSGDESVARLSRAIEREGWQGWARVVPMERNGGFAYGNNAGIRLALEAAGPADYVMLLNPDTIARPGAVSALVEFMDSHRSAGIAGSRLENADGGTEASAHVAFSPLGELESGARLGVLSRALGRFAYTPPIRDTAHSCDWVSGASLIVRREVFEAIGLLDEGYFLYFEEADFCRRARDAGWEVWFVPESRVVHLEGASTGIRDVVKRRPGYWYDSRRRYFIKHSGVTGLLLADTLWAAGRMSLALRRLLRLGSGGSAQDPKWFALDLLWGDLRAILSGRHVAK